jgi:hypothetical protein
MVEKWGYRVSIPNSSVKMKNKGIDDNEKIEFIASHNTKV